MYRVSSEQFNNKERYFLTKLTEYPNTGQLRVYDIEAISLPIVYNKFGDHDPNGMLYVLKQDSERIRRAARELFSLPVPQPYEEVRPLVIRANVGYNPDTTTERFIRYTWHADKEGVFPLLGYGGYAQQRRGYECSRTFRRDNR